MAGFIEQYHILFNKAKADFIAAKVLYGEFKGGNSELDLDIICFHLQQCAEKLLKALLAKNHVNSPKTHDLELLLNLVSIHDIKLLTDEDLLLELNDFAVEGRYAVIHDDLDNTSVYFVLLEELIETVYKAITKEEQ